jgi:hypothetical protein
VQGLTDAERTTIAAWRAAAAEPTFSQLGKDVLAIIDRLTQPADTGKEK